MITRELEILRYNDGTISSMRDRLLSEVEMELYLDQKWICRLNCTALHLEELTVGVLFAKGYIEDYDELRQIRIKGHCIEVLKEKLEKRWGKPNPGNFVPDYSMILKAYHDFGKESELFLKTGGVHSAKLMDAELRSVFMTEDMSRHNAIDKIIGYGLRERLSYGDKLLMVSSRMPLELVKTCYQAGLVNIASVSAATMEAVAFARAHNMNLMGMCRNYRFNIYSRREEQDD